MKKLKPRFLAPVLLVVLAASFAPAQTAQINVMGYVSRVTLVPNLNLGVVVLTNQQSGGAFQSLTYRILDHYLGAPPTDWIAAFKKSEGMGLARAAEVEKRLASTRTADSKPSLPLAKYAGRYTDAW